MPTITNASSVTITAKISKEGYETETVTMEAKIDKAPGKLLLPAYSGVDINEIKVTESTGPIRAVSSDTNIATVSVEGNTIKITEVGVGMLDITIISEETDNYYSKEETFRLSITEKYEWSFPTIS